MHVDVTQIFTLGFYVKYNSLKKSTDQLHMLRSVYNAFEKCQTMFVQTSLKHIMHNRRVY